MNIDNPSLFDRIFTDTGDILRLKMQPIGAWNMDTTLQVNIAHGLTFENIRTVSAFIYDDAMLAAYHSSTQSTNGASDDLKHNWNTLNIVITRLTGGVFDNANFNDAVMNRGYILIWYVI